MERIKRNFAIKYVKSRLLDSGYRVSEGAGCFDIIAKKHASFAVKVLHNIDSFTSSESRDLKVVSFFLETNPVLVGERANRYGLEDSVVYERFGISTMSPDTFLCYANGHSVEMKSRRGGLSVNIDVEKFKNAVRNANFSLSELCGVSGVSKKTIYKCAKGGSVDVKTYRDVERVMGFSLGSGVDVRKVSHARSERPESPFKRSVSEHLERIGFSFSFLSRSPFNLVMKEKSVMVSVASPSKERFLSYTNMLHELGREFDLNSVFITSHGNEKNMNGIPVVGLGEIKEMESCREFVENVEERQL